MEQRIQFARAADGTHIAFATSGEGPTLISVPAPPDNHLELEWEDAERRHGLEHISRFRRLVRFDPRGTGLSDRDVADLSLSARVSDLAAVIEKIGAETVQLVAGGHATQVAVAYAAENPDRVTHLVAVNPFIRGLDFMSAEQLAMYSHMLSTDFRMFTDVIGAQTFGWGTEEGPRYAAFFRACVEPAMAVRLYEAMGKVDLAEHLPRLRCPVLVVRSAGSQMVPEASTRAFAAQIADLHLASITTRPTEGVPDELITRVGAFFGEDWSPPPVAEQPAPAAASRPEAQPEFRTVLFTDIENHTTMMTRLGDVAGREVLRRHEQTTRDALRAFGGTEVKTMGDGFLASFRSTQRAIDCAVALQRSLSEASAGLPEDFSVRVGINAGEPIAEDGDLFGSAVITASRIVGLAGGGEILVSNVVRELVAGKGHLFSDRGQHVLRGFDEPVRVWSVRWREE